MPTMGQLKTECQLGALEAAMQAAVRDYKAEVMEDEGKAAAAQKAANEAHVDLLEDDELEELQAQRIKEMKAEAMRQQEANKQGHGQYRLINQDEFLPEVTTSEFVVCHFFHPEFQRCKIVDKHMGTVCRKYPTTKFVRLDATLAPFFVEKLKIQMLPCIVMFKQGIAIDRIVGFDELGGKDDFKQLALEKRLASKGIIVYKTEDLDSDEEEELEARKNLRGGALYAGSKYSRQYGNNSDDDDW